MIVNNPKSMAKLIEVCKSLQDARSSHIHIPQASDILEEDGRLRFSLRATIHDIVREDIAGLEMTTTYSPHVHSECSVMLIIQREVAAAVLLCAMLSCLKILSSLRKSHWSSRGNPLIRLLRCLPQQCLHDINSF